MANGRPAGSGPREPHSCASREAHSSWADSSFSHWSPRGFSDRISGGHVSPCNEALRGTQGAEGDNVALTQGKLGRRAAVTQFRLGGKRLEQLRCWRVAGWLLMLGMLLHGCGCRWDDHEYYVRLDLSTDLRIYVSGP